MGEITERVVSAIEANRTKFEAFCRSLSDEELDRPVPDSTWLVRDFVAHLGTLDPQLQRWFDAASDGKPIDGADGPAGDSFDIDAFNGAVVAERRTWPLERVLAEAASNRAGMIASLRRMADEQAQAKMYFAGDAKRPAATIPLNLFLAGWAQHDPIHVADMVKALPERAGDAELRAWLDNAFVAGYQRAMSGPPRG
ncbi:MAG: maleylpyruvate isomerase N-terminal domain-containing protein [Dehalococcoidia bacterium]